MRSRLTPRATQDIAEIADFIRRDNSSAALRVRQAILDAIELAATFPEAGRLVALAEVRRLVVRRFKYLVYYTIDIVEGEVVIVGVRHAARRRELEAC